MQKRRLGLDYGGDSSIVITMKRLKRNGKITRGTLTFEHEQDGDSENILVSLIENNMVSGSLACCLDTGNFSDDDDTKLTNREYKICEQVENEVVMDGIY